MNQNVIIFRFQKKNLLSNTPYRLVVDNYDILFEQLKLNVVKYKFKLTLDFHLKWIYSRQTEIGQVKLVGFCFELNSKQKIFNGEHVDLQSFYKTLKRKITFIGFSDRYKILNQVSILWETKIYYIQSFMDAKRYVAKEFNASKLDKMFQEIKINSALSNEFITRLKEIFYENNTYYLIFNVNDGGTLQNLLDSKYEDIQIPCIKIIMKQLIKALRYLKGAKVQHLDLKPSNIMFKQMGNFFTLKLIDFGLSKFTDENIIKINGTPGYIAPELFSCQLSSVSDMFSAGCIFYYMLFRSQLFQGQSQQEVLRKNQMFNILKLDKTLKQLGKKTADLLIQMLNENPQHRITPEEALEHEFFESKEYDDSSLDSIVQFHAVKPTTLSMESKPFVWAECQVQMTEPKAKQVPQSLVRNHEK